jgi:hypothetical protein
MTLGDEIKLLLEAPTMNAGDVRTLLRRDHEEALQLARDMHESESGDERRSLFKQLRPALIAHSRAEEREVYDVLRSGIDGPDAYAIADEGYVEHVMLDDLLERMAKSRKTDSDEWKAHAKVLLEFLEHHIEDEHANMFELLASQFSDEERETMGRRFLAAKARMSMKAAKAA